MTQGTSDVPLELIQTILGLLQRPELLTIRAANKTMDALATPKAFTEIVVQDRVQSAEGFIGLQSCEKIVGYVKSVVFRGSAEQELTDDGLVCVSQAMKGLSGFPPLSSLRLDFSNFGENWSPLDDEDYEPSYGLKMQRAVLEGVSSGAPLPELKWLTIKGLITRPCDILASESFAVLLRLLETLEVETTGPDLEGTYAPDEIGDTDFWDHMMTALAAAQVRNVSILAN
ncbi:hypothetical protein FB45DRAFT_910877 [Roridomyces roridus]|uniref:F-box domain-containing protein n=1 Tax=Roridomyces roridus TaxID=1738132 RepID=A0AAD7C052_9AGAR|nr:hypothetical protein FB45DRAFT_910877 [Roridomyces roridus]